MKLKKLIILLLIVCVFVSFNYYIVKYIFPPYLKKIIEKSVSFNLKIKQLKIDVFPPGIKIKGIELRKNNFYLKADEGRAELSPLQGILGKIILTKIILAKGNMEITVKSSGTNEEDYLSRARDVFKVDLVKFKFKNVELKDLKVKLNFFDISGNLSTSFRIKNFAFSYEQDTFKIKINRGYFDHLVFNNIPYVEREFSIEVADGNLLLSPLSLTLNKLLLYDPAERESCDITLNDLSYSKKEFYFSSSVKSYLSNKGCINSSFLLNTPLKGRLNCEINSARIDISSFKHNAKVNCDVKDLKINKFKLGTHRFKGNLKDFNLKVSDYYASTMGGEISGNGFVSIKDKKASFDLAINKVTIQNLVTDLGLPHSLVVGDIYSNSFKVSSNDLLKYKMEGRLKVKNFKTFNKDFRLKTRTVIVDNSYATMKVEGILTTRYFDLKNAIVSISNNDKMEVNGYFDYKKGINIAVKARSFPLNKIGHIGPVEVGGTADVECNISSDYKDLEVSGRFDSLKGEIFGFDYDRLTSRVYYSDGLLRFRKVRGYIGNDPVKGFVNLDFSPPQGMIDAEIKANKINLFNLKNIYIDIEEILQKFVNSPVLKVEKVLLTIKGMFEDSRILFTGNAEKINFKYNPSIIKGTFNGEFYRDTFKLNFKDKSDTIQFQIKTLINKNSEQPSTLKIESNFNNFVFDYSGVKSKITGFVTVKCKHHWRIGGALTLAMSDKSILLPDKVVELELLPHKDVINAEFKNSTLLTSTRYNIKNHKFYIDFKTDEPINIARFGPVIFDLQGKFGLTGNVKGKRYEFFAEEPVVVKTNSGGFITGKNIRLELSEKGIRGSASNPESLIIKSLKGTERITLTEKDLFRINIKNKLFGFKDLLIYLYRLNADVEGVFTLNGLSKLIKGRLRIGTANIGERVTLKLEDELCSLKGSLNEIKIKNSSGAYFYYDFINKKYNIKIQNLRFIYNDGWKVWGICNANIGESPNIVNCELPKQTMFYDLAWYNFVNQGGNISSLSEISSGLPLRFYLNIKDLSVVSKNQNLVISGRVKLFKEQKTIKTSGFLELKGNYRFRNVWFDVVNGNVRFMETRPGIPYLTVKAQANITSLQGVEKKYEVTAEVEGWADDLSVNLYSSPELTKGEIISLITFGFPEEPKGPTAGAKANYSNLSTTTLGLELLFGREMKEAVERFGISELRVLSTYDEEILNVASKLIVSSSLSKKLSLQYERNITENTQKILMNYRFTNKLSVTGLWDNNNNNLSKFLENSPVGNFGLKLRFSLDFDW